MIVCLGGGIGPAVAGARAVGADRLVPNTAANTVRSFLIHNGVFMPGTLFKG